MKIIKLMKNILSIIINKNSIKFFMFGFIKLFIYLKNIGPKSFKELLLCLPYLNNKIKKKLKNHSLTLEKDMVTKYKNLNSIPENKSSIKDIEIKINTMKKYKNLKKVSGIIYLGNDNHNNSMLKIFKKFSYSNPLHPDLFPSVRDMEIDIINMVKNLYKGNDQCCGNLTYGGTESILLACVTYRDYYRNKYNIYNPNMVCFETVHPAFDKACHYFGIKMKKIKNINKLNNSINSETILIVGSCPEYSYGTIDPIKKMDEIAIKRNVGFHVDCCMGGFLIPFIEEFDYINFNLKGITSFSIDTHKYGYTLKGSSILLFRNKKIKKFQHFIKKDWVGGVYATPTLMGSKSGGIIASTWSGILLIGKKNYITFANNIQSNLNYIKKKLKNNKDIKIIKNPKLNIIAFKSNTINIYNIINEMKKKSWNLTVMQNPSSFHFCITKNHNTTLIEMFCDDLLKSIDNVKSKKSKKLNGTLALYGSSTKLENSLFIDEIIHDFLFLLSSNNTVDRYK
jgi:sphinganine-1-phosphate aldolase